MRGACWDDARHLVDHAAFNVADHDGLPEVETTPPDALAELAGCLGPGTERAPRDGTHE